MINQKTYRLQWYVVAVSTLFVVAHLAWEYTHGGVVSHHLLARPDMPAISNWWGLVILPILGWLASWFVLRRAAEKPEALPRAFTEALGALVIGIVLSVSYTTGHEQIASYIFFGVLFSGLILPIYRAEYVFGFVLGMTFVFGAVLPTLAASIAVAISAISHLLVWPAFSSALQRMLRS